MLLAALRNVYNAIKTEQGLNDFGHGPATNSNFGDKTYPLLWVRPYSAPFRTTQAGRILVTYNVTIDFVKLSDLSTATEDTELENTVEDMRDTAMRFVAVLQLDPTVKAITGGNVEPQYYRYDAQHSGVFINFQVEFYNENIDYCAPPSFPNVTCSPSIFTCAELIDGITDSQRACLSEELCEVCPTLCEQIALGTAQAIVDCVEDAGKTAAVQALICEAPECEDATVNANGVLVNTVASGGTLEIDVEDGAGGSVGSVVDGAIIIGQATVNVNEEEFGQVRAEGSIEVPVVDESGDPVGTITEGEDGLEVTIASSVGVDSDGDELLVEAEQPFTCKPHAVAGFSATPLVVDPGETITFTDASNPDTVSRLWIFGDDNTSTLEDPTHIYAVPGTYSPILIATNASDNSAEYKENYITVNNYNAGAEALFQRYDFTDLRKAYINKLFVDLGSMNDLHNVQYMLAAPDETSALLNWVEDNFNITKNNNPAYEVDRGYTGSAGAFLRTGWIPSTHGGVKYAQSDAMMCVYVGTDTNLGAFDLGCQNAAGVHAAGVISRGGGLTQSRFNAVTLSTVTNGSALGFYMALRTAAGQYDIYKNGALLATHVVASTGRAAVEMYICTINNNGSSGTVSNRQIRYAAAGAGTGIDPLAYYNALQTYMTSIGANV